MTKPIEMCCVAYQCWSSDWFHRSSIWRAKFAKLKIDVVVCWWCPRQKVCVRNGWKLSWRMCERTLEKLCVKKCIDRWKCCFIFYFNRIQWVIHLIWWSTKGQGWEPDQNIKSVSDRPSPIEIIPKGAQLFVNHNVTSFLLRESARFNELQFTRASGFGESTRYSKENSA